MSKTYRRPQTDDVAAARARRKAIRSSIDNAAYQRFLETYNYDRYVTDGRVGPRAVFARSAA